MKLLKFKQLVISDVHVIITDVRGCDNFKNMHTNTQIY